MRFFEELLKLDSDWRTSEYASVEMWIRRLRRRGSVSTSMAYFKLLAWFVKFTGLSPDAFVKLPKDDVASKVQSFCDRFSDDGKNSTALNAMKALKSFLKANKFKLEELELDSSYRIMKRPEYVPNKEEVYRMATVCGLKWRAIILCLFQSGLRNSALRALTYEMVKDQLESEGFPIRVHITSELRKVLPDACKEGVDYWTFFGAEASEALRQYVNWRREKRGKTEEDELLFPSDSRSLSKEDRLKKPMDQWHLTRIVKKAARRAGIKKWHTVRAHSLRKTFRSVLDSGYVDGGQMAEDDKEYLMGHKLPGAKAPYHNANVDVLAQRYMKLNWAHVHTSIEQLRKKQVVDMAKLLGFSDEKIKKVEEALAKYEKVDEALEEIKKLSLQPHKVRNQRNSHEDCDVEDNCKKHEVQVVRGEKRLVRSLTDGWDLVKELSDDRFVLKKSFD
ncbi:tyrosine-type recombinase/integrase [Candidatus Bathyarchaeota archaeon]|nr:tyrosine-type recombinase/integrase [Candidatus Bathyarchaeota archaeon]